MGSLHLEKKGLRGLAIAESFDRDSDTSVLSGVVMRRDFVIDGFVLGHTTLYADDSTDVILSMYNRLHRSDINYLLISGLIISLYNVVDVKRLYDLIKIPVIGIAYDDSPGIAQVLERRFPSSHKKIAAYAKLGPREKIILHTAHNIFIRCHGCSTKEATHLLNGLTLQGALPEPIRISKMLSRVLRN